MQLKLRAEKNNRAQKKGGDECLQDRVRAREGIPGNGYQGMKKVQGKGI